MKAAKVLLVMLIGFTFSNAFAQGNISGIITDYEGEAIISADVLLKNTAYRTITDENGRFLLKDIPSGNYHLIVFSFGKESIDTIIQIVSTELVVNLSLKDLNDEIDEVVVQAEREKTFGITRLKAVENFGIYAGKKTEVIVLADITANLSTNNPRQIFSKITGLNIWESDGAGLQLGIGGRGLSPNRTSNFNTRQNGYDISADALGYPESYYTPPAEALEKIEIVRGAASLQYGTQFGGMLNFRFKKGPTDKKFQAETRQTAGSWGYFGTFNAIGGTIAKGKLNYYAFYQYKRGKGYRPNAGFFQHNAFVALNYQVHPRFLINAEFTKMYYLAQQPGGLTDKNFEYNPRQSLRERNWFRVNWNLLALNFTYAFNERTQLNMRNFGLLAYRQSVGNLERINVVDFGGNRTLINGKFKNFGSELRLLHRYKLGKQHHTFLAGTRVYVGNTLSQQGEANNGSGADFNYLNPDNLENSDYNFPSKNFAFFAENIFQLTSKLTLTPGIRVEYIDTRSKGYFKTRVFDGAGNLIAETRTDDQSDRQRAFFIAGIGLSYKHTAGLEFYGNFSQNYRAINFSDLRVANPNLRVDPNIRDEKGYTADAGIRGNIKGVFFYELTGFAIYYKGRIGQILKADQPPLYIDYRFRSNISDARNFGIETFAEVDIFKAFGKEIKDFRWTIFNNFAYVNARYVKTDDNSIKNKKVEMVPPITERAGTTLKYKGATFSYQVAFTYQQFSDATNAVLTSTAVEGLIPSYTVSDISLSYNWRWLTAEASCNNLFNKSYFTRRAESYPGPGIIPADGRGYFVTLMARWP